MEKLRIGILFYDASFPSLPWRLGEASCLGEKPALDLPPAVELPWSGIWCKVAKEWEFSPSLR